MIDVVGGEQRLEQREIAVALNAFDQAAHHRLVGFELRRAGLRNRGEAAAAAAITPRSKLRRSVLIACDCS